MLVNLLLFSNFCDSPLAFETGFYLLYVGLNFKDKFGGTQLLMFEYICICTLRNIISKTAGLYTGVEELLDP